MILGNLLALSEPQLLICKIRIMVTSSRAYPGGAQRAIWGVSYPEKSGLMFLLFPQVSVNSTKGACLDKQVSGRMECGGVCAPWGRGHRCRDSEEGAIALPWEPQIDGGGLDHS